MARFIRDALQLNIANCTKQTRQRKKTFQADIKRTAARLNIKKRNASLTLDQKRVAFEEAAMVLRVHLFSDWYNVGMQDLVRANKQVQYWENRSGLITTYLFEIYPDYNWESWKFKVVPTEFWSDRFNCLACLNYIGGLLNVKVLDDWNTISAQDFAKHGAGKLLSHFNSSIVACLEYAFPHYQWKSQARRTGEIYWSDTKKQSKRLEVIGQRLGMKTLDDWDKIEKRQIVRMSSREMLNVHNGSVYNCLQTAFPSYEWSPYKFRKKAFWQTSKNRTNFLGEIKQRFNITNPDAWYRVSTDQLRAYGGTGLLQYWPHVLGNIEPNFKWQWHRFGFLGKHAEQRALAQCIREIFPQAEVIEEATIGLQGMNYTRISVDIYIPQYSLAIEYQGVQHYSDTFKWHSGMQISEIQKIRDMEKNQQCKNANIHLVPIPYWWSPGDIGALIATLMYYYPDLGLEIPSGAVPLLEEPQDNKRSPLMVPPAEMNTFA